MKTVYSHTLPVKSLNTPPLVVFLYFYYFPCCKIDKNENYVVTKTCSIAQNMF